VSWIYSGTLPSVEDKSRYTAPDDEPEQEDEIQSPFEEGMEARVCCHDRETNPYREDRQIDQWAEWNHGWDTADQEPETETP
jgi:hypothetical protein